MHDPELEQIYRDARFMMNACAQVRRDCERQRGLLTGQRERAAQSRERQTEWLEKRAREDEQLYESRTRA